MKKQGRIDRECRFLTSLPLALEVEVREVHGGPELFRVVLLNVVEVGERRLTGVRHVQVVHGKNCGRQKGRSSRRRQICGAAPRAVLLTHVVRHDGEGFEVRFPHVARKSVCVVLKIPEQVGSAAVGLLDLLPVRFGVRVQYGTSSSNQILIGESINDVLVSRVPPPKHSK